MEEFYLFGVWFSLGFHFLMGTLFFFVVFFLHSWPLEDDIVLSGFPRMMNKWSQWSIHRRNCPSQLLSLVSQARGPRPELPIPWWMGEESACIHFTLYYISILVRPLSSAPTMLRGLVYLLKISLSWFEAWPHNTILLGCSCCLGYLGIGH